MITRKSSVGKKKKYSQNYFKRFKQNKKSKGRKSWLAKTKQFVNLFTPVIRHF